MDELSKSKFRAVGAIAVFIIAALSIFFVFYQAREKKNASMRLRSFYSDMHQTLQFSMNLNDTPEYWSFKKGYRNANSINSYIANYLRVSETCVHVEGSCFPSNNYKNLADKQTKVNLSQLPSVRLKNGMSLAFETISSCKKKESVCALVYVDINGNATPNKFGKDLFVFMLANSKKTPFLPYNIRVDKHLLKYDKKFGCNKTAELPMYCSAYIYDNNWQISKDYPW